jgi:superfamily II DNA helicase RecQ
MALAAGAARTALRAASASPAAAAEAVSAARLPERLRAAEEALRGPFQAAAWREHQRGIVESVLRGADTLAVLPTGHGKSLCFQLPAVVLHREAAASGERRPLTLVVSPLISLMEDQVKGARARGIAAETINSTMAPGERERVAALVRSGDVVLLYAAPETLAGPELAELLLQTSEAGAQRAVRAGIALLDSGPAASPAAVQPVSEGASGELELEELEEREQKEGSDASAPPGSASASAAASATASASPSPSPSPKVGLLVVDEAHCISKWGMDFRSSYRLLGGLRVALGSPPTLAVTASADESVRADVAKQLGLRAGFRAFVASLLRPNLFLEQAELGKGARGVERALEIVRSSLANGGGAMLYFAFRKDCEAFGLKLRDKAAELAGAGGPRLQVEVYHAGLDSELRSAVMRRFSSGATNVLCCTNAAGMGLDKPDVRLVLHVHVPVNIEAYYQELGRAGRDGKPARAVINTDGGGMFPRTIFTQQDEIEEEDMRGLVARIRSEPRAALQVASDAALKDVVKLRGNPSLVVGVLAEHRLLRKVRAHRRIAAPPHELEPEPETRAKDKRTSTAKLDASREFLRAQPRGTVVDAPEWARQLGLTPATVNKHLARCVEEGVVACEEHPRKLQLMGATRPDFDARLGAAVQAALALAKHRKERAKLLETYAKSQRCLWLQIMTAHDDREGAEEVRKRGGCGSCSNCRPAAGR